MAMTGRLRVLAVPELEPVTVDEVKLHAHIDEDVEDSLIAGWIRTGRQFAEGFQSKAYITQSLELILDCWWDGALELPRSPVQEVTAILYYDQENVEYSLDLSTVYIDTGSQPARIVKNYGEFWPTEALRSIDAVKVQYTAGYADDPTGVITTPSDAIGTIPADVADALTMYCTYRNENRSGELEPPKAFYDILREGGRLIR